MRPDNVKHWKWIWVLILILTGSGMLNVLLAQDADVPFYPKGKYLEEIPTPDEVIGFPLGSKPVRHERVIRYFRALAEKSVTGIYIVRDFAFQYVNPRLLEIFGCRKGELLDQPLQNVVWPADVAMVEEHFNHQLSGDEEYCYFEFRGKSKTLHPAPY